MKKCEKSRERGEWKKKTSDDEARKRLRKKQKKMLEIIVCDVQVKSKNIYLLVHTQKRRKISVD